MKRRSEELRSMVLCAMFAAIVIVMTVVPYTGYIPAGISITTLHIPVILCAIVLGWKYGALIGGVWGIACLVKAFVEPIPGNIPFQNPVISVIPRIIVGLAAAAVFALLIKKTNIEKHISAGIAAAAGTLTNTVLVLSALAAFGALGETTVADTVKLIIETLVAVNGIIELAAAIIIVPLLYSAVSHFFTKKN